MKCLIADDSRIIRMVLAKIFSNFGFEVEEAEDGDEVIEKCLAEEPDIIVMDWWLPVIDGIDVLYKIRNDRRIRQPRIVFCSANSNPEKISEALQGGADDYLMKPFDEEIIKSKLIILGLMKE